MKSFLLILLFISAFSYTGAQNINFKIEVTDSSFIKKQRLFDLPKQIRSAEDIAKARQDILAQLYRQGYLAASFDSTVQDSARATAYLTLGKKYRWAVLKPGNVDEGILSLAGFREKIFTGQPLNYSQVARLYEKIITQMENNGYPFATVMLDSVMVYDNTISAKLHLNKNILIDIDSIIVRGNAKISHIYLYNYLGIKPGHLYNEELVKKITVRLKELPFVTETRPHEVVFTEDITKIILYLDRKKASQGEGMLGILPDNETPGKVLLTGDMRLKLLNSFGRGEVFDVNVRKLQTRTQDIKAGIIYPYLFSSRFGFDGRFELYSKDTTFINVSRNIGLQYLLSGTNYFKVFVNLKNASPISQSGFENLRRLPDYADISTTLYGIGLNYEKLDYRFNPRRGFRIIFNGAGGFRKIEKNLKIDAALYDSIALKSVQYDVALNADVFIPVMKRSTIRIGTSTALLESPAIFENELFRFGGFRTLRGFDEESIFASFYSIATLELRYLLEQNSYAYLFWNSAYYENEQENRPLVTDTPYGFGAGVSFETKAGIFSISYALGSQFGNPILLRTGKVHFGIAGFF